MNDTLSYSQMLMHRKCPQAWKYRYIDRLDRLTMFPSPERDMGNWWHALRAAESIVRGREHDSLKHCPETIRPIDYWRPLPTEGITVEAVRESARLWWASLSTDYREAFVDALGLPIVDNLTRLDAQWTAQWARERALEHPVAVEMRWEREVPTTGIMLVGYIDEVYLHTKRKMLVVRDHKSHKVLGASTTLDDMMDSQLQFYAWGAAPMVREWGLGPLRATAYDRVKSTAPKSPQVTATGLLSKSITDYDYDTYVAWAAGPDGQGVLWGEENAHFASGPRKGQPKWGHYTAEESVLEKLATPVERSRWFQRTLTPLNGTLVQSHLVAGRDTAEDIKRTRARVEESGEAGRNLTKNCAWCDYADLCRAQLFGGPRIEFDPAEFGLERK